MAFTFDVNAAATNGAGIMLRLKQSLTAAGWTVLASGTGSAGTYSMSTDLISTLDANLCWFVIKHPTSTFQFCIQNVSTPTTWRIKASTIEGFIGGSPSATVTPTASDETVLIGGGTNASPTGALIFDSGTSNRGNIITGGSAEKYAFVMIAHASGTATTRSCFAFDTMVSNTYPVEDLFPFGTYIGITNTSIATLTGMNSDYDIPVYQSPGGTPVWRAAYPMTYLCNGAQIVPSNIGTDVITGNDLVFPLAICRYGTTGTTTNGPSAWKGFSTIFHLLGTNRAIGDTLTINSTKDYLVIGGTAGSGHIAIPWNGTDLTI